MILRRSSLQKSFKSIQQALISIAETSRRDVAQVAFATGLLVWAILQLVFKTMVLCLYRIWAASHTRVWPASSTRRRLWGAEPDRFRQRSAVRLSRRRREQRIRRGSRRRKQRLCVGRRQRLGIRCARTAGRRRFRRFPDPLRGRAR